MNDGFVAAVCIIISYAINTQNTHSRIEFWVYRYRRFRACTQLYCIRPYIGRCSRSDIKTRGEEVFIYYKEARRVLLQTSVIFSRCKPADVVYSFVVNKDIERFTVFIHYFYIHSNLKRFTVQTSVIDPISN